MPTVEEIFEESPESWESLDDYLEDDPGGNAEQASDETSDKSDKTSDGSDGMSDGSNEIEPGDRIFMTTVHDPAEFIRASSTTSQCLSEAFTKNSAAPKSFHESVPPAFHDFEDVFSKVSFDVLPDRKPWDHAIELEADARASSTKVYPLSPNEQAELDIFIEENLASGRIRPSKSPMAALVFFIKKKDGVLRLVQDYRALNAKTWWSGPLLRMACTSPVRFNWLLCNMT
jgi:hypothetical protein